MKVRTLLPSTLVAVLAAACGDDDPSANPTTVISPSPSTQTSMSFFVTSTTSTTGNLGGLAGADARCQSLAAAAGQGAKTWRA